MSDDMSMDKDFLTIGEFAEIVGMSPDTLRRLDKSGVFRAAKRGVEFENEYRLYAPPQIIIAKMIRVLTEISVLRDVIKGLAHSRNPLQVVKLLTAQSRKVADELSFLQEADSVNGIFRELISEGLSATENELFISERPERKIILGNINDFEGSTSFYGPFRRFCTEAHEPKPNLSYPVGGYFESMEAFLHEPSQPTRFFSLDPKGYDAILEGLYLTGYTRGYYGQTNGLPERMAAFASKNGLIFSGSVYNIYLFDELSESDPDKYLLRVTASVKETRRVPSRRPIRQIPAGSVR